MLKCLNRGEFYVTAREFDRWIYAGEKVSECLKNSFTAEKKPVFDMSGHSQFLQSELNHKYKSGLVRTRPLEEKSFIL